mgnify:CR=1 FL=1
MSNFISCINTMLSPLSKPKGKGDKGDDQGDGTDTDTNGQDGDQNGDQKGGGQDGDSGDQKGDGQGDGQGEDSVNETPTNTTNDPNQKDGNGAGGGVSEIPQSLLDQIKDGLKEGGSALLDNNSAMEQAIADKIAEIESTCLDGEKPYIVGDTSHDKINIVREGSSSKGYAQQLLNEVREQTNYLRSSLRQMVRAMEHTNVIHGTRRGNFLSNRTLVDTALSMRNSRMPKRAFYNTDDQVDTSIACAICLDESGSMGGSLSEATKMLIALTEPIDQIGGKVLAYGFRNTYCHSQTHHPVNSHRHEDYYPLVYDVFKSWNERFTTVKGRFAHTIADGSTPMSDGIQFGLDQIKYRTEKHRIIFVLTDGEPNWGHQPVIAWQQRVAKEMGIHIVGVGWGRDAAGVKTLYKDNVWCQKVEDVPSALVSKLRSLLKERVRRKVS